MMLLGEKKFTEKSLGEKNNKHHTNLKRKREREKIPQIKILEYHFSPPAPPQNIFLYLYVIILYFFNTLHFVPFEEIWEAATALLHSSILRK